MEFQFLIFCLLLLTLDGVINSSDIKSSLTFVIDDTNSMTDDIDQVKFGANAIFDTVMNSNASQIEDFILVTINDPYVKLRTQTNDRATFKGALGKVFAHNDANHDCEEMSMSGIKLALQTSREGSTLYVFTDASAKDYEKYDEVVALSQKKGCQIVFVLTGECYGRDGKDYVVYNRLASGTNGQVFHLNKNEINQVLIFVQETVKNRKHIIATKIYPPGYGNKFDVTVDGDTKELLISVSGDRPKVSVTDPTGTKCPTTDIIKLQESAAVRVDGVKPGVYKVEVGSMGEGETRVVVLGSTTIHFQHGFSVITPSTIADTVAQPVPGENSHLAIRLATDGGDVELFSVQMRNMDDKVILKAPLKLVDKNDQFYTTDLIPPPKQMFKIAIKGYDNKSKSYFTRLSLTPIQPQMITGTVQTKVPVVNIVNRDIITAEYDKPLQLQCKVSGYPKPSVIWESDDKSAVFSHTVSTVEIPYDFVSVLDIRSVKNNAKYWCKAVNSVGRSEDNISVKMLTFFNVDETKLPKDTSVEYHKQSSIPCQVEASPPAIVSWYKGLRPLRPDGNLVLSQDGSVLTIRSMEPYMADDYICEARNPVGTRVIPFRVHITGVESPEINKNIDSIIAFRKSNVDVQCRAKGTPKPAIQWWYKDVHATEFTTIEETSDTIHFDSVTVTDAGQYRCMAKNVVGEDYYEVELTVEYEPSISGQFNSNPFIKQGEVVTLTCDADGNPPPNIIWKHNGAPIRSRRHTFLKDGSIRFPVVLSDEGVYECEARNVHGTDSIKIDIHVNVPVEIEPPMQSFIQQMVGLPVALPCRADGIPKPTIKWIYRSKNTKNISKKLEPSNASGQLRFDRIQQQQSGLYTCVATNSVSSKNITYEVFVLAPPSIGYTKKDFHGVINDVLLTIPCAATGYPAPEITWSIDGRNISSGSQWFDIGDDGSLTIKNLEETLAGAYVCTASNKYGKKQESFNVLIDQYPKQGIISNSIVVEEGTSAIIPCTVPQKTTDRLRWFKDGRIISSSEMVLRNIRHSDAGIYTCRVSSMDIPAQSGSTKIVVGYKPQFKYHDDARNITFVENEQAFMDCSAIGYPNPEVQWFHNGKVIEFAKFTYEFDMIDANDRGRYTCYVSNFFGTIKQEFFISSSECLLDVNNDFNDNEPLMLTPYGDLTNFEAGDGFLHIPNGEKIKLVCPSQFNAMPTREITVTCETEKQFKLQPSGMLYDYSDLKCSDKFEPVIKRTRRRCTKGNSEMLNVGFYVRGQFKEIYQVCLDLDTKNMIYTKLNMHQPLANSAANNDTEWFNYGAHVDLDSLYDCSYQNSEIASILDQESHRFSGCCFERRMLVNPKDVAPGLPQAATYTRLNVAPHWGTCNSKNWEDLEQRVRDLVVSAGRPLQVWTGTAKLLQLTDAHGVEKNVFFNSGKKNYHVPKYLWKVVQDTYTKASLAIIQVNVPDLKLTEAHKHLLCTDVCRDTEWMKGRHWRNVDNGFTYCCSLEEFERAFRFEGSFPHYDKLLRDTSSVPVPKQLLE